MENNFEISTYNYFELLPPEIFSAILNYVVYNEKNNNYFENSKNNTFFSQLNNIKSFFLLSNHYSQFFKPNIQKLFKQPDFIENWLEALSTCIYKIEDNSTMTRYEYDQVDYNEVLVRQTWYGKKLQLAKYFQQLHSLKKLYRLYFDASEINFANYSDKFYLIHAYCTSNVKNLDLSKLQQVLEGKDCFCGLYGALKKTIDVINSNSVNRGYQLANQNLRAVNLAGINLKNCSLKSINLVACDLSFAYLQFVRLADCSTDFIIFDKADLSHSDLSKIHLRTAKLDGTNFEGANLSGSFLAEGNLSGLNFQNANLQQANLRATNLSYANLSGANLQGANLKKTNLLEAKLTNANVNNTALHFAQLTNLDHILAENENRNTFRPI